ncbi:MAG TPA: TIGR03560 family F420-dependent LLM class oxidoreductase [Candidatus Limnocylindrales bacterium]|nr:TIGR03560 family F420-dependent LLM class oxidoreductase [Candidatus Limnocylindrales bacterium]
MAPMRLGLDVAQHQLTWPQLLERVLLAEQAGFESAWLFDHFKPLYGDPKGPCLEAWTLLAGLSAATTRIRLGVLVTGVTYRHPSILATEAITVDHISKGRLEIGMGAAWHEGEHAELGVPFPAIRERAERLEEAIQLMRDLMTRDRVSFEGSYYQLEQATYRPRPVQQPHPPFWIGASGEQLMLPIVGRQADVWHAFGSSDHLERKSRIIDEHAERAGRDPRAIVRSTSLSLSQPWDRVRRHVDALQRAGFSYLVVSWPSEGRGRLEEFMERIRPEIAAAR